MIRSAAVVATVGLALAGCGGGGSKDSSAPTTGAVAPALAKAFQACTLARPDITHLGDGGHSLLVTGLMGPKAQTDLVCVLKGIKTPQYIYAEISSTTALQGTRTEDAGGFHYEWSYHPDNGLDMVVHDSGAS